MNWGKYTIQQKNSMIRVFYYATFKMLMLTNVLLYWISYLFPCFVTNLIAIDEYLFKIIVSMPIIFYFVAFVLLAISLRLKKDDIFFDKNSSNVLKGFFILLIVFSHILNSFPYSGFLSDGLNYFRAMMGQYIVSIFFFVSGYGIIHSINRDGDRYSKSILANRLLRILIYTTILLIPFFIYSACLNKPHGVGDYFLALVGLESFGNETWFIFAILICYLLSGIVFLFKYSKTFIPLLIITLGIVTYIIFMFAFGKSSYMWDTIICFPIGMFVCLFRNKVSLFLSKKKIVPFLVMIVSISLFVALRIARYYCSNYFPKIVEMWFSNALFCLFFVSLTKVFFLKSPVLNFLGKASFPIFLMHRLVICCFEDIGTIPNIHANYVVLFIAAVLIGIPFYFVFKLIDRITISPIVKWNRQLVSKFEKSHVKNEDGD